MLDPGLLQMKEDLQFCISAQKAMFRMRILMGKNYFKKEKVKKFHVLKCRMFSW
jgi:hypothetical protein